MAKLLIVDDEEDVREFAASFFRKRKIEVFTASSGEDALNIIEKEKPNLVLLDIKMSAMDGLQTLENLRKKDNQTKVIMVTGKKPEEDEIYNKCRLLGAFNYIHKPLKLDELEKVVLEELITP
jgi:DNA-binding response OmpR family regulator